MRTHYFAALVLGLCAAAATLSAAPTFWHVGTQAEFLKGEVENLSIDSHGRLLLGPASTTLHEPTAPFIWCVLTTPDGVVYAGTGNDGQVIRVDPSGAGTVFFDAEEMEVHALAPAPGGGLFVATSPDGRIYRVSATGQSSVVFDPPEKYLWSLAVDRAGNLFAATGDTGRIYRIAPNGTATPYFTATSTHVMALAFDRDGRLLAGTASPGRVLRFDAAGAPFVLLESTYDEVRSLRPGTDGTVYATAVAGRASSGGAPAAASEPGAPSTTSAGGATVTVEVSGVVVASGAGVTTTTAASRPVGGAGAGGVYRVNADTSWDLIWESREDVPYDVLVERDGSILIATGNKGKVLRLAGDPFESTLLTRAAAKQVTALFTDATGATAYATSNPARVVRLSTGRAATGVYQSDVRDAQTTARWGTLTWRASATAGARVAMATRSGNTRLPDETWSPWTAAYANAEGTPITSPRARYIQWRASFTAGTGDSPLLTSVTTAYLPRNLRPRVTTITVHPPGTVFQRPFPSGDPDIAGYDLEPPDRKILARTAPPGSQPAGPALGKRAYQRGLLTLVWHGDDDNGDDLRYDVRYRREGETAWQTLRRGLTEELLVWDTMAVPSGTYILRVVASDATVNPAADAQSGHLDSQAFDIDNTPPTLRLTGRQRDGARTTLQLEVRDDLSVVQRVEYSLDGSRWEPLYPTDGIADSRTETYQVVLETPTAPEVMIRATDALGNVGGLGVPTAAVPTPAPAAAPARR